MAAKQLLVLVASHRKDGETALLVRQALSAARLGKQVKAKVLELADFKVDFCRGCLYYCEANPLQCSIEDDDVMALFDWLRQADGLLVATPLYLPLPSKLIALAERLVSMCHTARQYPLEGKPCGLLEKTGSAPGLPIRALMDILLPLRLEPVTTPAWPFLGCVCRGETAQQTAADYIKKMAQTIK